MVTTRGKQASSVAVPVTALDEGNSRRTSRQVDSNTARSKQSWSQGARGESESPQSVTRLRKRRRIDNGHSESQSHNTIRSTRHRKSGLDLNEVQLVQDVHDGLGHDGTKGDPELSINPPVDPRLTENVSSSPQPTDADAIVPTVAGNALRGTRRSTRVKKPSVHVRDAEDTSPTNGNGQKTRQSFIESAAPDLSTVIESIIKHGETIDDHFAARGLNQLGIVDTESFLPLGASAHLKIQSLPILDNLSVQILNVLAKSTYSEIVTITEDPDSEAGQAYATLKSLFDHAKKVYSVHDPFLLPHELGLTDPIHLETIRKANLATFVSSVFGGQDVGFYHLNEYFLDTFVGDGNRLLKSQGQLFLDLKTQAYISARSYGQRPKDELLDDIFPHDMEERLLARKGPPNFGIRQLAPSEIEFLQRARNRSQALMRDPDFQEVNALSKRYAWEDFLRDISTYVSKNFESLLGQPMHKNGPPGRTPNYFVPPKVQDVELNQHREQQSFDQQPSSHSSDGNAPQNTLAPASFDGTVEVAQAADAATQGFGYHQGISIDGTDHSDIQSQAISQSDTQIMAEQDPATKDVPHEPPAPSQGTQDQYSQPPPHVFHNHNPFISESNMQPQLSTAPVDMNMQQQFYGDQPVNPHPTQSAPTQVLYERARQAATAKASPINRRTGHPSQRRPWSHDEENALMAGLDRVKGPHWSQILAMFGPGGTINETLKDRNQVQLKDKARNLKLFFLKSGIEVPYYLQFVTGELKTRAPGQAAKNEAKERENDSEERAHVEGVFALAYGPDSVQGVEHGTSKPYLGPSGHTASQMSSDTRDIPMDDAGYPVPENDLSMQIINAARGSSQPSHAPEANMMPYSNHNPVTPNFQAMVDLAVAEAARVNSGAG